MRWMLGMIACAALAPVAASPATAADLDVAVHKTARGHHLRVVRDYDGTPIALRRRLDGTEDAHFVQRASPTRYLNGQRVTLYR